MNLEKILLDVVRSIVDTPDEVRVTCNETDSAIELTLTVAPDEMGMVIGKHGKIAKAIRTVIKSAASGTGKKVTVDIKD